MVFFESVITNRVHYQQRISICLLSEFAITSTFLVLVTVTHHTSWIAKLCHVSLPSCITLLSRPDTMQITNIMEYNLSALTNNKWILINTFSSFWNDNGIVYLLVLGRSTTISKYKLIKLWNKNVKECLKQSERGKPYLIKVDLDT